MAAEPQISFLIPVYNMAATLPDALKNLFRIREFPLEIIVINDGSTDAIRDIIIEFQTESEDHDNIKFKSINIQNSGRAGAINRGAEIARGLYLSFMDADDLIDPDELVKLWNCAQSKQNALIFGQFKIITETGIVVAKRALQSSLTKKQLVRKIAFSPLAPVHLNAAIIHRTLFLEINGFDRKLIRSQDKDLTLRVLEKADHFSICNSYHYLYRKHRISKKFIVKKRLEWMWYRQKMIRKNFTGFMMITSLSIQFCYDVGKLLYESLISYDR